MAPNNGTFTSEMSTNSNRFSESEPLLRTRILQTENDGYDTNKKICGFRVEGPEGVRAWWVAFAAFSISFITAGVGRVYGILLPRLLSVFEINREMASVPFSLQLALRNLFGPLVGIMGHKFGVQKVTFIGAVISAVSTALCCWTNLYVWIVIYWGVITGIGVALSTNLLQLTIGQYFEKNKATAMGMSLAGGCLGSIALPHVIEIFLQLLSLKFVFLCMGGILALAIPFATAFKEPPWLRTQRQQTENYLYLNTSRGIASLENSLQFIQIGDFSRQSDLVNVDITKRFFRHMPNITFLRKHKELLIKLLRRATILELKTPEKDNLGLETSIRMGMDELFRYMEEVVRNLTEKVCMSNDFQKQCLKPMYGSSVTDLTVVKHTIIPLNNNAESSNESTRDSIIKKLEKISLLSLPEILSVSPNENKHDILNIIRELTYLCHAADSLKTQDSDSVFSDCLLNDDQIQNEDFNNINPRYHHQDSLDVQMQNRDSNNINSRYHHLGSLMQSTWEHFKASWKPVFILYKNPLFLFISICRLTHFISFVPVLMTMGDFLDEKHLPEVDDQYGVISLSVGDFLGRMFTGWVTDKGYLKLPNFMAILMLFQCVSNVTLPLIHNRILLFISFTIFGLLNGANFVRHPVLISNYMKKEEQPFAMGSLSFFSGVFACLLPFYVGLCKDTLGTYNFMLYISGALVVCVGLSWIVMSKRGAFRSLDDTPGESDEPI